MFALMLNILALFSVAAPRAVNAHSAELLVLPTTSGALLAQPDRIASLMVPGFVGTLSEGRRRAAENRKALEQRREQHKKKQGDRRRIRDAQTAETETTDTAASVAESNSSLDSLRKRTGLDRLQLVHIPKTGGSTLELLAQRYGLAWGGNRMGWPSGNCPFGCPNTFQPCSPWHIPPAAFLDHGPSPYEGYDTFCVVRHPFTRAISEYTFMDAVCTAEGLNDAVHSVFKAINKSVVKLKLSFPHMLPHPLKVASRTQFGGVCAAVDHRFHCNSAGDFDCGGCWRSTTHSDCHWLPQHLYSSNCTHVLRVESLEEDFSKMMLSYGNAIASKELENTHVLTDERPDLCRLSVSDLDSKSLAMLRELYAQDFEQHGYEPELLPSRERFRLSASKHSHGDLALETIRVFGDDLVVELDVQSRSSIH